MCLRMQHALLAQVCKVCGGIYMRCCEKNKAVVGKHQCVSFPFSVLRLNLCKSYHFKCIYKLGPVEVLLKSGTDHTKMVRNKELGTRPVIILSICVCLVWKVHKCIWEKLKAPDQLPSGTSVVTNIREFCWCKDFFLYMFLIATIVINGCSRAGSISWLFVQLQCFCKNVQPCQCSQ